MTFLLRQFLHNQLGTLMTLEHVSEHCWPHMLTLFSVTHLLPGYSVMNTVPSSLEKVIGFYVLDITSDSACCIIVSELKKKKISLRELAI